MQGERPRWRWIALALLLAPLFLARVWIIDHLPDPDTDAAGHLGIAHALLSHPTMVSLHWVYLPAYHYILALLEALGLSATAIRILNAALAALVPVVVLRYGESTAPPTTDASRHVPLMAALFCAISPLVNLLGTSAQQETLFVLLVLGTVWSIDVRRYALGGMLLGIAALVRYEAWGAVALLVAAYVLGRIPSLRPKLPAPIAEICALPGMVVIPSLVAIGGWLLAHKISDGQWFGFLRELYRYAHVQRVSIHRTSQADWIWFPVRQPLFVFGWIVAGLFFIGIRRAWRPSAIVPLGIYAFLQGAYLFKGALGSARYYESLMPFVALGAANGAFVVAALRPWAKWRRWIVPSIFAAAFWQLAMLSLQMYRWTWPSRMQAATSGATEARAGVRDASHANAAPSARSTAAGVHSI